MRPIIGSGIVFVPTYFAYTNWPAYPRELKEGVPYGTFPITYWAKDFVSQNLHISRLEMPGVLWRSWPRGVQDSPT